MDAESLLDKIEQQSNKEQTAITDHYKALGTAFANAWVELKKRQADVENICRVAYAYLSFKRYAVVLPYTDRNKIVVLDWYSRPMAESDTQLIPICFRTKNISVLYYPDGTIYVADTNCVIDRSTDVTLHAKEIRDSLNDGKNDSIARINDNLWVRASTIAEGISTIFNSLDALSNFLTETVNNLGKSEEASTDDDDKFEWLGIQYKWPRLSAEERGKIDKFVHATPPNSDSIANIFNLLIRFARETIDDSRRSK